jgi:VanZ family protein
LQQESLPEAACLYSKTNDKKDKKVFFQNLFCRRLDGNHFYDKFVHICLFGGFVLLWGIYYESKKLPQKKLLRLFFIVFIIACLYGTGMEYVQKYFIPMRDFDTWDIIADLVGAGLAYGICNMGLTGIE